MHAAQNQGFGHVLAVCNMYIYIRKYKHTLCSYTFCRCRQCIYIYIYTHTSLRTRYVPLHGQTITIRSALVVYCGVLFASCRSPETKTAKGGKQMLETCSLNNCWALPSSHLVFHHTFIGIQSMLAPNNPIRIRPSGHFFPAISGDFSTFSGNQWGISSRPGKTTEG